MLNCQLLSETKARTSPSFSSVCRCPHSHGKFWAVTFGREKLLSNKRDLLAVF